jgi:hypothetical protein
MGVSTMRRAVFRPRARRAWLLGLVLPALLLRAFIPAGFMPAPDAAGMSIVLCPGEAALPPGITGPAHHAHGHVHHAGSSPAAPATTHHELCLFAAAGAAASAPALPALAVEIPAFVRVQEFPASGVFFPSILRAQHPRGPPASLNA